MKKAIIIFSIALAMCGTGCSKTPKGSSTSGSYTCTCSYKKNPLKDTVVYFNWSGVTYDQAKSQCDDKQAGFTSYAGKGGASCSL